MELGVEMKIGGGRGNFLEKVSPPPSKPPPSPPKIFDLIESLFNGFSCLPKKGREGGMLVARGETH